MRNHDFPSPSDIAQDLVQKADALVHELEKVLAQPTPEGKGFAVGYSMTISNTLEMALLYLTMPDNQLGWMRRRKLKRQIETIRELCKKLNLKFMNYVEAYYEGSVKAPKLHSELNDVAASIKDYAHAFAKEIMEPN